MKYSAEHAETLEFLWQFNHRAPRMMLAGESLEEVSDIKGEWPYEERDIFFHITAATAFGWTRSACMEECEHGGTVWFVRVGEDVYRFTLTPLGERELTLYMRARAACTIDACEGTQ